MCKSAASFPYLSVFDMTKSAQIGIKGSTMKAKPVVFREPTSFMLSQGEHRLTLASNEQSYLEPKESLKGLPDRLERNFAAAVLDGVKDYKDGDYEDPELHMVQAWKSIQILPARPIKESEYADTRYFKGVMDTPHPLDTKTSVPTEHHPWHTQMGLEKETDPQKETSTESPQTVPALGNAFRNLQVPHYQMKPESIHLSQNQSTPEIPLAIASSPFMTRNYSVQNRDHKESMQFHPPQRCQSPARFSPQENLLHYKNTSWRKPFPTRSDAKDVQQNDWYIGEHSRKAVEEALRKENKDGTFLVRDCSTKSRAEPYVLVVFYGNKVYNVKIRFLEKNQQFALGTGLRGDEKFNSVGDIIEHYKYVPIVLIDGKDKTGIHREQCYLTQPLPLSRCFSPW
ncbi:hypothetical protein GH733_005970 [Mirounga leonina]|nr:hypothetical protein GH733_005970 [Mirounga leonina]